MKCENDWHPKPMSIFKKVPLDMRISVQKYNAKGFTTHTIWPFLSNKKHSRSTTNEALINEEKE